jgi:tRNA threonylcarbamoyladenosine biosynthesis protein TsaE
VNEALDLGIDDYFEGGSFCFIEWPGIIKELLPANVINVMMTIEGDDRVIKSNL